MNESKEGEKMDDIFEAIVEHFEAYGITEETKKWLADMQDEAQEVLDEGYDNAFSDGYDRGRFDAREKSQ